MGDRLKRAPRARHAARQSRAPGERQALQPELTATARREATFPNLIIVELAVARVQGISGEVR
jgi:hypothetical protein